MFTNAHTIYEWGLTVIRFVQSAQSPALTALIKAITALGSEAVYLAVVLALFAVLDRKKSFFLTYSMVFSAGMNLALKNTWCVMRPFRLDPSVMLTVVGGYSTPSGHAQAAAVFWLCVYVLVSEKIAQKADETNAKSNGGTQTAAAPDERTHSALFAHGTLIKRLMLGFSIFMIAAIGFSRVYLGVHYPTDVLLGWALGAAIVGAGCIVYKKGGAVLQKFPVNVRVLACAVPSFVLLAIYKQNPMIPGGLFGLGVGYVYATERGLYGYTIKRAAQARAVRKIGLFLCMIVPLALGAFFAERVLPPKSASFYRIASFAFFGVLGLCYSFGSAYVFALFCKIFCKATFAGEVTAPSTDDSHTGNGFAQSLRDTEQAGGTFESKQTVSFSVASSYKNTNTNPREPSGELHVPEALADADTTENQSAEETRHDA